VPSYWVGSDDVRVYCSRLVAMDDVVAYFEAWIKRLQELLVVLGISGVG
jgi:hypothetical protein